MTRRTMSAGYLPNLVPTLPTCCFTLPFPCSGTGLMMYTIKRTQRMTTVTALYCFILGVRFKTMPSLTEEGEVMLGRSCY